MKRALGILCIGIAACSSVVTDPQAAPQAPAITTLPRTMTTGEQKVVSSVNTFSWSLFNRLADVQKGANIFVSPLSASMALGMTMNGAAGATYDQMRNMLAYGSATDAEINGSYRSLISLLDSLDGRVNLKVGNSIWYERTLLVKQAFFDTNKQAFDALVAPLDFSAPASVGTINAWVNEATQGAIPSIIDKINSDDVMFLINAIYFKGAWRQKFDPAQTIDAPFHGTAGDQPMKLMHRLGDMRATVRPDLVGAELFYGDSAFSMVVLMPTGNNSIDAFATSLNSSSWNSIVNSMPTFKGDLFLPRLKLEWDRTLNDDLIALGMRDAFSDVAANFSRMTPAPVVISRVKQKSYVEINEEGTTAAAVTSVGATAVSAPPQVRIDRPFVFAIRERLTGTILFVGKIVTMP